ncbi:hypothetical protein NA56DRAFT_581355, partial [Hyaloscypha hepaticicola]
IVIGDGTIGKTYLLISYIKNKFPIKYIPIVFDNYIITVMVGNEPYLLGLFDTASQEDYDCLRPLSYPETDIFLICFSIVSWVSFRNIYEKWVPEISYYCPGIPFLIVGTQTDLREDTIILEKLAKQKELPVGKDLGEKIARKEGAVKYIECSALLGENGKVKAIFDKAIFIALEPLAKKKKLLNRCSLL